MWDRPAAIASTLRASRSTAITWQPSGAKAMASGRPERGCLDLRQLTESPRNLLGVGVRAQRAVRFFIRGDRAHQCRPMWGHRAREADGVSSSRERAVGRGVVMRRRV
jgi:hypothetical protein